MSLFRAMTLKRCICGLYQRSKVRVRQDVAIICDEVCIAMDPELKTQRQMKDADTYSIYILYIYTIAQDVFDFI